MARMYHGAMINCAFSMLPIPLGAEVVAVLLMQNPHHPEQWEVRAPPLHGKWAGSALKSYRAKDRETLRLWVEGFELDRVPEHDPPPLNVYHGLEPKGASPSTRRLFDLLFRGEIRVHRPGEAVKEQILAVSVALVHRQIWDQMLALEPEEYLGEVMTVAERTALLRRLLRGTTNELARVELETAGIVHMPRPEMNGLADHLLRMARRARPPRHAGTRGTTIRAAAEVIHLTQLLRGLCRSWTPSIWNGPGDYVARETLAKYQEIVTTLSEGLR